MNKKPKPPSNLIDATFKMPDGTRLKFKVSDIELPSLDGPRKIVMTLSGAMRWLKKGER